MKTMLSILAAMVLVTSSSIAYPISPRPLRKLIQESEYIVVAYVQDIQPEKRTETEETKRKKRKQSYDDFVGMAAVLKIDEVLQGKITDSAIHVSYYPYFICPAPAHFEKGTTIVAFLDKKDKTFTVHALSYGTKTVTPEGARLYKERIKEMQNILRIADKDDQFIQTTEWLVKCSEHPATRHEGVYELSRESDFMSYYDRTQGDPFQFMLTAHQKERLKDALLSTKDFTYSELGLVDLVYAANQEVVYHYLLDALQKIQEDNLWMASAIMQRLTVYKSSPRLNELVSTYDDKMFESRYDSKVMMPIIQDFLGEIGKL